MIITNSNFTSPHLIQLRNWYEEIWGEYGEFTEIKLGIRLPSPILAINNEKLIGGLAFTAYQNPEKDDATLWINALYVHSSMRGLGVGSKLINSAEKISKEYGYKFLYAQTNVPELYVNNGWSVLNANGEDIVLKKEL